MKKKLKAEQRLKSIEEMNRIQEILRLQNLLDSMGSETAREHFKSGKNGALVSDHLQTLAVKCNNILGCFLFVVNVGSVRGKAVTVGRTLPVDQRYARL